VYRRLPARLRRAVRWLLLWIVLAPLSWALLAVLLAAMDLVYSDAPAFASHSLLAGILEPAFVARVRVRVCGGRVPVPPHALDSALPLTKRFRDRNPAGLSMISTVRNAASEVANQGSCSRLASAAAQVGQVHPRERANSSAVAAR
jgi:hypothetical protein